MENSFYETKVSNTLLSNQELNDLASIGFSLVGFTYDGSNYIYIFSNRYWVITDPADAGHDGQSSNATQMAPEAPKRFMFKNALINLGVSPQLAADWIKVRQAKRAAQTETAFRIIEKQVKLGMETFGVTADDIIKVAIDKNWQGLKCEWLDNIDWKYYGVNVGHTDLPFDNKWE